MAGRPNPRSGALLPHGPAMGLGYLTIAPGHPSITDQSVTPTADDEPPLTV